MAEKTLIATETVVQHTVQNVETFFAREQLLGALSQLQSDQKFFVNLKEELNQAAQQKHKTK